jgi:hypothetical protein
MVYVFIIQKEQLGLYYYMAPRSSCREGFRKLDTLTVSCLYIYGLMLIAVKSSLSSR